MHLPEKILYLLPYPQFFSQHAGVGGHVAHVSGIISGFQKKSIDVTVLAEEFHEVLDLDNAHVELAPCRSSKLLLRQIWFLRFLFRLRQTVIQNSFDFCYMRYSASFAPWIPLVKKILGKIPLILEVNSLGSQWHKFMKPFDKFALRSADRVICVSRILENNIKPMLEGKNNNDVRFVPNGVDAERFEARAVNLFREKSIHVGYAGLLKTDYGIETLIAAARALSNFNIDIHIFGDGPYRTELEGMVAGVKNIFFHGPIPFTEMPSYLKAMDILVYTTSGKYLYQSPTKIFEYMAAGKPIVSARTPQTSELLEDETTALFFEIGNSQELAKKLKTLAKDLKKRELMGQQARREALEKHSWAARVEEMLR